MKIEAEILPKLQRASGRIELGFIFKNNLHSLSHLHQSGCLKALIPKNYSTVPDVVLVNTSGGITGGDKLQIQAGVHQKAHVCITSQTAERVYKSSQGMGEIEVELNLSENSKLDWIPQETILFDKSAVQRSIKVNMSNNSYLFMVESIILGRKAMGENVTNNLFVDRWQILRDNKPTYLEALKLSNANELSGLATLGKNKALATLLYVAPDSEERLQQMRELLAKYDSLGAATAWDGKLIVRLIAESPQFLRSALIDIITQFRKMSLPRVWLM